jgi:glycine dehydrogenase subunit 1
MVNEKLKNEGIIGGYELQKDYPELENTLLFCATEMISKEDIDKVASILK